MHILLTGGAGFIGSHVTADLLSAGHRVTIIDDLSTGSLENVAGSRGCRFLRKRLSQCIAGDVPDSVEVLIHLAATPSVQSSWTQATEVHENNLTETLRILHWCRERKIRRLVFASSAAAYGHPVTRTIAENHPTIPLSPYGLQKLTSEAYGRLFAEHDGFKFVALRFFNVYGPRQRADSAYAGVLARFVSAFAEGRDITILGDGRQTRDFVSVSDVARAVRAGCEAVLPDKVFICNVGTGVTSSLLDVVAALRDIFPSWKGAVRFGPASPGDIRDSLAEVGRMHGHLGVRAEASLREGLRRLAEWHLKKTTTRLTAVEFVELTLTPK